MSANVARLIKLSVIIGLYEVDSIKPAHMNLGRASQK